MSEIKNQKEPTNSNSNQAQTIIVNQQKSESNGTGTAGFVLALIAAFLVWLPILNFILWLLGLILSFVGVFKKPRGLAIAGLVISLVWIILLVLFFSAGLAILGIGSAALVE